MDSHEGFCVKCKTKRPIQGAERTTMKNGTPAVKGKCGECGTGMFTMLKRGS